MRSMFLQKVVDTYFWLMYTFIIEVKEMNMPSEHHTLPKETHANLLVGSSANKHLPVLAYEVAMFDNPSRTLQVLGNVCKVVGILAIVGISLITVVARI